MSQVNPFEELKRENKRGRTGISLVAITPIMAAPKQKPWLVSTQLNNSLGQRFIVLFIFSACLAICRRLSNDTKWSSAAVLCRQCLFSQLVAMFIKTLRTRAFFGVSNSLRYVVCVICDIYVYDIVLVRTNWLVVPRQCWRIVSKTDALTQTYHFSECVPTDLTMMPAMLKLNKLPKWRKES